MPPEPSVEARAKAEALILARQRLRAHVNHACEQAGRGNIPAARFKLDDAMSELDEIGRLRDELGIGDA
jgi:16S rRNA U1498 N3-methylase RsmE